MPTLRLHGLYFAVATLAFAEMVRLMFELFRYQVMIDGEPVGPNGSDGFRGIRYIFENDVSPLQFLVLIYALLPPRSLASCCWSAPASAWRSA